MITGNEKTPFDSIFNYYISAAGPTPNEIHSVELYARDNAKKHRTSNYEILDNRDPPLVIRRGDPFFVGLQFRKPYDAERDKIRMEFMFVNFR
ncbi:hemocyte protein-glutamine gamma-glutamyltransferase-like protein [Leptotrombidium deliense]|uniref:Hemocyte protein-glutamine gamma-glutamyltransferase-like protein n=1 Tax=Leptotrombidium deliense TaxID=299467 RepID=A0A443SJA7_9ACAR|nr:hemocyte protein-glutamine gamma-glutamyltransferase-like protein [Leptotrombidium deliense]